MHKPANLQWFDSEIYQQTQRVPALVQIEQVWSNKKHVYLNRQSDKN